MIPTLETPHLRLKKRVIKRNHSEHISSDNVLVRTVAEPLFYAGINCGALTERTRYDSVHMLARPYHDLTVMLQGKMTFVYDDHEETLTPGMISCIPAGVPFRRSAVDAPSWWIYWQIADELAWSPIRKCGPYVRPYPAALLMFLLLREVLDATVSHEANLIENALAASSKIVALIRHEVLSSPFNQSKHAVALEQLADEIAKFPHRPWNRLDIASRLNLSVRQASQIFREELGFSPHELVLRQRMNRAIDLLIHTDRPIKVIATDLGYDSLHSFTRLFSKHVGLPPGIYRTRNGFSPNIIQKS